MFILNNRDYFGIHFIHADPAPSSKIVDHKIDHRGRSLDLNLNAPVSKVLHPAGQAMVSRIRHNKIAETYTLDTAVKPYVPSLNRCTHHLSPLFLRELRRPLADRRIVPGAFIGPADLIEDI